MESLTPPLVERLRHERNAGMKVSTALRAGLDERRRYGGLSSEERRARRRARLLDAGLHYYGTIGFRATTIPQICSLSGVTARHFYEEFGTQERLLRAVFDRISGLLLDAIRKEINAPGRTWTQLVRESCAAYFRELTGDGRRARIFSLEIVGVSRELDLHRKRTRDAFAGIAAEATAQLLEQGGAGDVDIRMLSIAVAGAADALVLEWALARPKPAVEVLSDQLASIWIRTLGIDRLAPGLRPA